MAWQRPVIDRTAADVAARDPVKGMLGVGGFNRIEGNTDYLAGRCGLDIEAYTGWRAGSLVFERDMRRVCEGLKALREYSGVQWPSNNPAWLPAVPDTPLNHFEKVNQAETLQLRVLRGANQGAEGWRYVSGSTHLGSEL